MGLNSYDDPKVKRLVTASVNSVLTPQSYNGTNGRVYCPYQLPSNLSLGNATAMTNNLIRAIPFVITRKVRLLETNLFLLTANVNGGSKYRMGIYAADTSTIYPTGRLWQSAEVVIATTGAIYTITNLAIDLEPGIYYFVLHALITSKDVLVNNKDITFRGLQAAAQQIVLNYASGAQTLPINRIELTAAYNSAGLPETFPAGGALQTTAFAPEFFTIRTIPVNS